MNLALLIKNICRTRKPISLWLACLLSLPCAAQTFQVLHHFSGDTFNPEGSLALVGNTIYGTTRSAWGTNNGTVYKINTDGSGFAVLKKFTLDEGSDPLVGLTCSGTTLYGATYGGGAFSEGTIFRVETDGSGFRILKSFDPSAGEGALPGGSEAPLLVGNTLFGTTGATGSDSNNVAYGWGTVYRIQTDGTGFTMLKNFPGSDESYPAGSVVLQGQTLFGTTSGWEGANLGTVFKVNTDGTGYNCLWRFSGASDASFPLSGVVLSGNTLFGTTYYGPNYQHYGSGTCFG